MLNILCEELTHWKRPWCWEGLGTGGEGDNRGWDGWMASPTRCTRSLGELRELVMDREARRATIHGVAKNQTWLSDWTELNWTELSWNVSLVSLIFWKKSHSIVFLYLFALITEEGFLISCYYSLEFFAFRRVYLSFFPLPFPSLVFSANCKASSDNHFAFFHFFFLITASCTMSQTSIHISSGTLSIKSNPLNLFLTSTV